MGLACAIRVFSKKLLRCCGAHFCRVLGARGASLSDELWTSGWAETGLLSRGLQRPRSDRSAPVPFCDLGISKAPGNVQGVGKGGGEGGVK